MFRIVFDPFSLKKVYLLDRIPLQYNKICTSSMSSQRPGVLVPRKRHYH